VCRTPSLRGQEGASLGPVSPGDGARTCDRVTDFNLSRRLPWLLPASVWPGGPALMRPELPMAAAQLDRGGFSRLRCEGSTYFPGASSRPRSIKQTAKPLSHLHENNMATCLFAVRRRGHAGPRAARPAPLPLTSHSKCPACRSWVVRAPSRQPWSCSTPRRAPGRPHPGCRGLHSSGGRPAA